jgi:hypothetical protein
MGVACLMPAIVSLVLLAPLSALAGPASPSNATTDAELLLAFKASLANGNALLSTWRRPESLCGWTGITCNSGGRVTGLSLPNYGLQGELPPALPETLEELDLSGNLLRGALPAAWGLHSNLSLLRLENNTLDGGIPASWSLGDRLKAIHLYNNSLQGGGPSTGVAAEPCLPCPMARQWLLAVGRQPSTCARPLIPLIPAGPLPFWSTADNTPVYIRPGNLGLCASRGKVCESRVQSGAVLLHWQAVFQHLRHAPSCCAALSKAALAPSQHAQLCRLNPVTGLYARFCSSAPWLMAGKKPQTAASCF